MLDHWTDFHALAPEAGHIGFKPYSTTLSPVYLFKQLGVVLHLDLLLHKDAERLRGVFYLRGMYPATTVRPVVSGK
jgi:hypothetical protein